jgi:NitT/TauT family transport system permease protein
MAIGRVQELRTPRYERVTTVAMAVLLILSWEFIASFYPSHQFPSLIELLTAIGSILVDPEFAVVENVSMTLARIFFSVVIAMLLGVSIGVPMGLNKYAESYLKVYVLISLAVPALIWALLATLWFGLTSFLVPVFTGVLVLLPYVIINSWEGAKSIDSELVEMATAFGGSGPLLWYKIYYPQLLPFLLSSLRTIISIGWKIMLVAEIFGAQTGVGFVINRYFILQRNDMILAWTIPMMAIIFGIDRLLHRYENQQFDWRDVNDETVAA